MAEDDTGPTCSQVGATCWAPCWGAKPPNEESIEVPDLAKERGEIECGFSDVALVPNKAAIRPLVIEIKKDNNAPSDGANSSPDASPSSKHNRSKSKRRTTKKLNKELGLASEDSFTNGISSDNSFTNGCRNFSFTFRFFNYNMANRSDLSLEELSGFVALRERSEAPPPVLPIPGEPQESEGVPQRSLERKPTLLAWTMVGSKQRRGQVFRAPVSLLSLITEGLEKKDVPEAESQKTVDDSIGDAGTSSTCCERAVSSDSVPDSPKKSRSSLKLIGLRNSLVSLVGLPKRIGSAGSMNSTDTTGTLVRRKSKRNTRKMSLFSPLNSSGLPAATSVDCVFGTLCETQFPLDEYTDAKFQGGAEFHSASASQCLKKGHEGNATHMQAMKGRVAEKVSGDLKTFTLCRSTFTEFPDGKVFCSYDESSQAKVKGNPMKSFIGRVFTAASGTLRFVLLGTHFPMQKVASLMEDTTKTEHELLQKMKSLVARLLQKILCHLSEKDLINSRTMVILQGDLNSRCISRDGKYMDLLWETLQDSRLQSFICRDLPEDLHGAWREVVDVPDPDDLPVTYRFAQDKTAVGGGFKLQLRDIYTFPVDEDSNGLGSMCCNDGSLKYRAVLENLRANGVMDEWGLYSPKVKDDKDKFKPSRLPACTERVIYYTPASMMERCQWETSRGYEVNYLHTGSDHKPVLLEATLNIREYGKPLPSPSKQTLRHQGSKEVPDDFEDLFLNIADNDSDCSDDFESEDSSEPEESKDRTSTSSSIAELLTRSSSRKTTRTSCQSTSSLKSTTSLVSGLLASLKTKGSKSSLTSKKSGRNSVTFSEG